MWVIRYERGHGVINRFQARVEFFQYFSIFQYFQFCRYFQYMSIFFKVSVCQYYQAKVSKY